MWKFFCAVWKRVGWGTRLEMINVAERAVRMSDEVLKKLGEERKERLLLWDKMKEMEGEIHQLRRSEQRCKRDLRLLSGVLRDHGIPVPELAQDDPESTGELQS